MGSIDMMVLNDLICCKMSFYKMKFRRFLCDQWQEGQVRKYVTTDGKKRKVDRRTTTRKCGYLTLLRFQITCRRVFRFPSRHRRHQTRGSFYKSRVDGMTCNLSVLGTDIASSRTIFSFSCRSGRHLLVHFNYSTGECYWVTLEVLFPKEWNRWTRKQIHRFSTAPAKVVPASISRSFQQHDYFTIPICHIVAKVIAVFTVFYVIF